MIGFIGIGNMGLAMALRLRDAGHAVRVRDIDADRVAQALAAGATAAETPAALAGCGLVIVAVVTAAQTREVLFGPDGLAAALPAGGCVMLCPTIAPADAEACAARLAERGIGCIDAPMSGGPERARDGTMSLMVACSTALFERWQPLLQTLASRLSASANGWATVPAPSSSTTCSPPSTWPVLPKCWRWRSVWGSMRRRRWR